MLKEYVYSLAEEMGLTLSRISVIDGRLLGCRDSHLLQLYSEGTMESVLVYQREIQALQDGARPERLEHRIRIALSRLRGENQQGGRL